MHALERLRIAHRRLRTRFKRVAAGRAAADGSGDVVELVSPMLDPEPQPVTKAYEAAEWVRLRLRNAGDPDLRSISRAVAQASYYLSDTMDPADRVRSLTRAEAKLAGALGTDRAANLGALEVLREACRELARLLRGRHASAELRIAMQALAQAEGDLVLRVQQKAKTSPVAAGAGDRCRFDTPGEAAS